MTAVLFTSSSSSSSSSPPPLKTSPLLKPSLSALAHKDNKTNNNKNGNSSYNNDDIIYKQQSKNDNDVLYHNNNNYKNDIKKIKDDSFKPDIVIEHYDQQDELLSMLTTTMLDRDQYQKQQQLTNRDRKMVTFRERVSFDRAPSYYSEVAPVNPWESTFNSKQHMFRQLISFFSILVITVGIPLTLFFTTRNHIEAMYSLLICAILPLLYMVYVLILYRILDIFSFLLVVAYIMSGIVSLATGAYLKSIYYYYRREKERERKKSGSYLIFSCYICKKKKRGKKIKLFRKGKKDYYRTCLLLLFHRRYKLTHIYI